MSNRIIFSDIDFSLKKSQYSDFTIIPNFESIHQAIETILMTKKGNRIKFQNPYFGSNIHLLLFEKMTVFSNIQIKEEIEISLEVWEPRIRVTDVIVESDYEGQSYNIDIKYIIIDINIEDELVLKMEIFK